MEAKTILVPVKEGGKADAEALRLACEVAKNNKGKIYAVHIIEVKRDLPLDAEVAVDTAKGEEVLREMARICKDRKCPLELQLLQAREVGPAIVQEAMEREADLVILGIPYKKRFGSFNLGQTVPYILKNAPCNVILWREAASGSGSGS